MSCCLVVLNLRCTDPSSLTYLRHHVVHSGCFLWALRLEAARGPQRWGDLEVQAPAGRSVLPPVGPGVLLGRRAGSQYSDLLHLQSTGKRGHTEVNANPQEGGAAESSCE